MPANQAATKPPTPDGDTAAKDPPNTGTNAEGAGARRAAGIDVDRAEADARTQQAEQKLNNNNKDDAAHDGSP